MLFPIIKVVDNCCDGIKRERIVGTNSHDRLFIENNAIHYLNAQCMAGTQYPDEGYSFVGAESEWSITCRPEIEFLTLDEIIDLCSEHLEEAAKAKIKAYKTLGAYWEKKLAECAEETGVSGDTSGELF